jgi:hypothetical protein
MAHHLRAVVIEHYTHQDAKLKEVLRGEAWWRHRPPDRRPQRLLPVGSLLWRIAATSRAWEGGIFAAAADLTPYQALIPTQPLTDVNPPSAPAAHQSLRLDFSAPDGAPPEELNAIPWRTLKGGEPYPAPARISTLDVQRGF